MRVLLSGGGTSGHVNPALAIADALRKVAPETKIFFAGTPMGVEKKLVDAAGYPFIPIRATGFPSRPSLKLMRAYRLFHLGRKASAKALIENKIDVVVGTGGYVCAPVVAAAHKEKIPVVLHEQNAYPGRSNRVMAKKSFVVCTGFLDAKEFFSAKTRVVYTGNPVREEFFSTSRTASRKELKVKDDEFFVVAMGGSLGSARINTAVMGLSQKVRPANLRVALSVGRQHEDLMEKENEMRQANIQLIRYIERPHIYMAAADLLVCRAGAITCAEIAASKAPAIFVPYPYAAGDHQNFNAKIFEARNAGICIQDDMLDTHTLFEAVFDLYKDPNRRKSIGKNAATIASPNASHKIVEQVLLAVDAKEGV